MIDRETILRTLENRIETLEAQLEREQARQRQAERTVFLHPAGDDAYGVGTLLPLPRLQMTIIRHSDWRMTTYTDLVWAPFWAQADEIACCAIESTTTTGLPAPGLCEPFRGSMHLRHDAEVFGLPAYVIDKATGEWARVGTVEQYKRPESVDYIEKGRFDPWPRAEREA